jgi:tetratricopeptide (TPR) repeat protein
MRALLLAIFAILLGPSCAHDPELLYREGVLAYQLGEYDRAIDKFTHAYKLTGAPPLLFDLAQAYRLKRNPRRALPLYRAYLRMEPRANNRPEVEQRIAELRKTR